MPTIFAFQLVADALGVRYEEGKARWDQAQARLKRQKLQLPPTSRAKPPGARQHTPTLDPNDAPKALALVLKDPLEFFEKDEKLVWLRSKVQEAGGDPKTVDAQREVLLAEKAQREADAQSLVLPGLKGNGNVSLRTARENDEVLGSVLDYLRWLGVEDEQGHTWANFRQSRDSVNGEIPDTVTFVEKHFPGQSLPTPFTNFAGYRLLTKLCLHKSKIAQGMHDEAMLLLGHVKVGDQRLHEVLDVNAASSSGEAKAFVLGALEAEEQKAKLVKTTPLDLERGQDLTTMQPKRRRVDDAPMSDLSSSLPVALPEGCLDWVKDFAVSRQELRGVKLQFKAILSVEISAGQLPQRSPVELWTKAPPLRFREMAVGAVSSYRSLSERQYGTMTAGDAEHASRRPNQESDSDDDDDILKISEIMSTAGVWRAVWSSYRSDLANRMLSLKCAETGATFSARRPEIVQGHVLVLVHKYKKSTDWPLAWTALQNTRDVYEKRVRECLDDMFQMAGRPTDESSLLARDIAARLRVSA
jgi:hypothetical protein